MVEPSVAQAIAVTVHELSTNAAKYGALSVADGRVQIEWSRLPMIGSRSAGPRATVPRFSRPRRAASACV